MPFSIKNFTPKNCEEWKINKQKNPTRPKNPQTNYRIEEGSKIYKIIESHCNSLEQKTSNVLQSKTFEPRESKPKKEWTKQDCEEWNINKTINPSQPVNPHSNRKISVKSALYKTINKECNKFQDSTKAKSKSIKSNSSPIDKKVLNSKLSLQDCIQWMKDKTKNPKSGYTLGPNSEALQAIKKECQSLLELYNLNEKQSSKSSSTVSSSVKSNNDSLSILNSPKKSSTPESHFELYYPDLDDAHFREKLVQLAEYYIYHVDKYQAIKSKDDFDKISNNLCKDFEKTSYQYFVSNYISNRTPYKSILLYHGVGVGKTCSAITLAEGFLTYHSAYEEPKIWVIMPLALKNSFKDQIFNYTDIEDFNRLANQCTGDLYIKLAQILRDSNKEKLQTKIKKLIKTRYRLFTYEGFATFIENEYIDKGKIVKDKVIIVDEAHNIRSMATTSSSSENSEKRVYSSLVDVLSDGINNRLVLLSATPMYNKPEDIFDLLYLLCLNDKRQDILSLPFPTFFNDKNVLNKKAVSTIERLSQNYVSYLKGKNPFTFAIQLSPKYLNNIDFLGKEYKRDSNNKAILSTYNGWLSHIKDGIVTSVLGEQQLKYVSSTLTSSDDNNVFNNLQPMNIVYDDTIGERGFNTFFTHLPESNNRLIVRYNKDYVNALYPDSYHLGKYSGKLLNICNILKNTKGIVVIYSGYIWSGIVPLAVCLEHMGFNREGAPNILPNAEVIPNAPKYDKRTSPKYCILSSENTEIMGGSSIDNLMKTINNPKNIDGSQIKVVLITPVAGEGLSFYNVREMHIMEPWFHFNRVTQIIGRGIRNCRHQDLPIEERNVTVFMHGSIYPQNIDKETTDIHAFRIASHKLIQCDVVNKIIRDNAVDCMLMKNINYFPKDIFELGKVKLRTSQNVEIEYAFGDSQDDEPKCLAPNIKHNDTYLRRDIYKHLIFAFQNKLRKIILNSIHNNIYYIQFTDIVKELGIHKSIIYETISASVYPNTFIEGYILVPHEDGLHIIHTSANNVSIEKLRIQMKDSNSENVIPSVEQSKCNMSKLRKIIEKADDAIIALYIYLSSDCFEQLVKSFIENKTLSEVDDKIASLLYSEGALITKDELGAGNIGPNQNQKYIGYVNIFNAEFEPIIYVDGRYRDLIDREKALLISRRRKLQQPANMAQENMSWGMIVPVLNKKTNVKTNAFKLLTAGSSIGVKTGIVCTSLQKQEQEKILNDLGNMSKFDTKAEYCHQIAKTLKTLNRLTLYPEYKPI